jgi:hypothetical protein
MLVTAKTNTTTQAAIAMRFIIPLLWNRFRDEGTAKKDVP